MPKTKTTPRGDAYAAAEAVRQLNHDTLNIEAMTAPEISSTVRGLLDLVDRLPQAFEQLANHLEKQLAGGQVRMEDGRHPAAPVAQAVAGLRRAAALASPVNRVYYGDPAGEFSSALHDAAGWLYNMGGYYVPEDEDEDA